MTRTFHSTSTLEKFLIFSPVVLFFYPVSDALTFEKHSQTPDTQTLGTQYWLIIRCSSKVLATTANSLHSASSRKGEWKMGGVSRGVERLQLLFVFPVSSLLFHIIVWKVLFELLTINMLRTASDQLRDLCCRNTKFHISGAKSKFRENSFSGSVREANFHGNLVDKLVPLCSGSFTDKQCSKSRQQQMWPSHSNNCRRNTKQRLCEVFRCQYYPPHTDRISIATPQAGAADTCSSSIASSPQ